MTDYTKVGDPCPLCKTPLKDGAPICIYCPNEECPVDDDCDLWYIASNGEWKRQDWIQTPDGPNCWRLTLTPKE